MTTVTKVKLVLAIVGLLLFAAGARFEVEALRWVAIAMMAGAFLLRFVKGNDGPEAPPEG
ncbi:MAG: hypothetical protein IT361_17430 [Gemmatimonadaceae bacterium]|nr:hypothetical protein [Gemmatimonadaceae bacterium]